MERRDGTPFSDPSIAIAASLTRNQSMKFYCFYVELFHVASEASFWLKAEELTG